MSISFTRYVRITSAVGGGAGVAQRELIARLLTASPFISPDEVLVFTNAADVGAFFGIASEEYARAVIYFTYVSANASAPERISFAAFNPSGNAAMIIGNNQYKSIETFKMVTDGQITLSVNGADYTISGVNFEDADSLADCAEILETALVAADPALAEVQVTLGGLGPTRFQVSLVGDGVKLSARGGGATGNNLALMMGLTTEQGALNITGSGQITAVGAMQRSENITNNFGSIAVLPKLALTEVQALAAYNATRNTMYQYHVGVLPADAVAWSEALIGYAGLGLTLSPNLSEFPEMLPMAILAATRYNTRAASVNYMYKQIAGLSTQVSNDADADKYDALRINYYGDTSTAGQKIAFYQRGLLMGGATAATDMGVYANEQWFKDLVGSQIMSLLLSVGRVPANNEGRASILSVIQGAIDQAITNGTISIGKRLTPVQKVYVTQQTGNPLGWQTVESAGYILDCQMQSYTTANGATEYKAVYSLIYSKDDAVRYVEGAHKLI